VETGLILRAAELLLRLVARIVPLRDRDEWLREWQAELSARREQLITRHALTRRQEVHMFRRVLGSVHDAAWLRRQFTRDADIVHDLRYGARLLRRNPLFSALTVAVLALGIGASVGIFSVVDTLLFRPLAFRDADRIVVAFEAPALNPGALEDVAPGTFLDWRARARSMDVIAAAEPFTFTYTDGDEPQALPGHQVTAGFFDVFGVQPLYGRLFASEEYQRGRDQVVVLGYAVWVQYFGADPSVVGKAVRLNGRPRTVVGIMPSTFTPRLQAAAAERGVWSPKIIMDYEEHIRGSRYFSVVGRLKADVSRQQAQAEFDLLARRLAQEHPPTNTGWTAQLVPLRDHLAGRLRTALGPLIGAVVLLLIVAAANTANLLMARNAARYQEIAIRAAIGAARPRLLRQFAAETLLLAALGCAGGVVLARFLMRAIVLLGPADVPAFRTLSLDSRVLVFAAALATVTALLIGVLPAWRLAGRPERTLRTGTTGQAHVPARQRFRVALVAGELAIALTLLTGFLRAMGSGNRVGPSAQSLHETAMASAQ